MTVTLEIFSVPIDGSLPPVSLGKESGQGGYSSIRLDLTPDSHTVIYEMDMPEGGSLGKRVYSVPVDGSTLATLIAPIPVSDAEIQSYQVAPDGQYLFYTLASEGPTIYRVPITGPAEAAQRIYTPSAGSFFTTGSSLDLSPNGEHLVFSIGSSDGTSIYSLPTSGGPTVLLDGPFLSDEHIGEIMISGDGQWVVYERRTYRPDQIHFYSVPINGRSSAVRLSLTPVEVVCSFCGQLTYLAFSPDSRFVVYGLNTGLLFIAQVNGTSGSARQVGTNQAGQGYNYAFSPDSKYLLYVDGNELFSVASDGSTPPVALSDPWTYAFLDRDSLFTHDGTRILYMQYTPGDTTSSIREELFSVPITGPSTAGVRVSDESEQVTTWQEDAGGMIVYQAFQRSTDKQHLSSTPFAPPGVGFETFNATVGEGAGSIPLTVTLDTPVSQTVTVSYTVSAGTASADDFIPVTDQLTFAPCETTKTITVAIAQDTIFDPQETVVVRLGASRDVALRTANTLTLTIRDDEGFRLYLPVIFNE